MSYSSVLLTGFSTFAASLTLHILIWRLSRPRNDIRALFMIFIAAPVLVFAGIFAMQPGLIQLVHWIAVTLLHIALSSAYIQTYPTAQAISPSLEIMILVARNGGLPAEEIEKHFTDGKLVLSRFDDLLNAGLAEETDGKISLTSSGKRFIRSVVLYRKLLGVEYQGG